MWQEIVIILIGVGVVAYVGWKVYQIFKHPKGGCSCGCCSGCPKHP